jgi:phage-related minor tail protein
MTTLAANISNAGGIAKMFQSTVGLLGSGFKILGAPLKAVGSGILGMGKMIIGALPAIGGYIASMWAAVAPTLAATWPILAIIAAVALLAAGVYLLIKNWDTVAGFFKGLWDKVCGFFTAAWEWIKGIIFGASDWILAAVAVFMPIIGIPALIIKHWDAIKTFFTNLWNDPKATIMGFIDWIGGKVEALIAPFKMVGDVVGGVFSKVGGFFKGLVGGGKESGTALNDAFASGIQGSASAPAAAFGSSLQGVSRQMPHSDAPEGPLSEITSSGRALTDTFASGMDESALREKASVVFSAAMPQGETVNFPAGEVAAPQGSGSQSIHIQNLYLQADDCQSALDFVRMIMQLVNRPQEAMV